MMHEQNQIYQYIKDGKFEDALKALFKILKKILMQLKTTLMQELCYLMQEK